MCTGETFGCHVDATALLPCPPTLIHPSTLLTPPPLPSFGMCLVACIRAEKTLSQFLLESLRKDMGRKTRFGIGMFMLNNKMLNKNWRPKLPRRFVRAYPGLNKLIKECWQNDPSLRPDFESITHRMNHEIRSEVMTEEEPNITLLSKEDDSLYGVRMSRRSLDDISKTFEEQVSFNVGNEEELGEVEEGDESDQHSETKNSERGNSPSSTSHKSPSSQGKKTPAGGQPPRHSGRSMSFDDDMSTKQFQMPGVELAKLKNLLEKEREKVDNYETKLMEMGIKISDI